MTAKCLLCKILAQKWGNRGERGIKAGSEENLWDLQGLLHTCRRLRSWLVSSNLDFELELRWLRGRSRCRSGCSGLCLLQSKEADVKFYMTYLVRLVINARFDADLDWIQRSTQAQKPLLVNAACQKAAK